MTVFLQRAAHAFGALPATRRYLLLVGWVVVLTLLLVLIGRPVVALCKELRQWPGLAQQAQALSSTTATFSNEYWQAWASARNLLLTRVEQRGDVWQLQGELSDAYTLTQLMRSIQDQGARPLRWSLERGHQGLVFSLDVIHKGGRP